MQKSEKLSLNARDLLKAIPPALSWLLWYYLSNVEVVNNLLIQMWADPKLLTALFPLLTYIGVLWFKGK